MRSAVCLMACGWLLAACHAGVTPLWASEIEPFPCAVTARHYDIQQRSDVIRNHGERGGDAGGAGAEGAVDAGAGADALSSFPAGADDDLCG